jgi:hypothetical protein
MKINIQLKYWWKRSIFLILFVGWLGCQTNLNRETKERSAYELRMDDIANDFLQKASSLTYDTTAIPRSLEVSGALKTTTSKSWTSGFYSGSLWQLYDWSKEPQLKDLAVNWMMPVEKEKFDSTTHDLGFKLYCSYGQAYRITGQTEYKEVFLQAAKTMIKRFNTKVGAIRSWDHHQEEWKFPVIVDNMLNLELLFEATKMTGDSTFYHLAVAHATTTMNNHFREDNSSYHVVSFDPSSGEVEKKNTHQGAHHESSWSRGQAWGLYGFTMAYRYTKKDVFLRKAENIAGYILSHPNLPADGIPFWDYDAAEIPKEPRDVSAAAVTASALLELCRYSKGNAKDYVTLIDKILMSLEKENYQAKNGPFILDHSVGSVPGDFEVDVPISYADYYYVEALMRRIKHAKSIIQNN